MRNDISVMRSQRRMIPHAMSSENDRTSIVVYGQIQNVIHSFNYTEFTNFHKNLGKNFLCLCEYLSVNARSYVLHQNISKLLKKVNLFLCYLYL